MRAGVRSILADSALVELGEDTAIATLLDAIGTARPDVVVLDAAGADDVGTLLARVAAEYPRTAVLVLAADPAEPALVEVFRAGALGCLLRNAEADEVVRATLAVAAGLVVMDQRGLRAVLARRPSTPGAPGTEPLSQRELEVLQLLAKGHQSKQIAQQLGISENTVKFHVSAILGKLGATGRTEAVTIAIRQGLVAI